MALTTAEIEERRLRDFKKLVTAWHKATDGMFEMQEHIVRVHGDDSKEVKLVEMRHEFETEYLKAIAFLMNIDVEGDFPLLLNDDWFWAEWTATDNCFWFVYGLTAGAREDFFVNKHNRMIDATEIAEGLDEC